MRRTKALLLGIALGGGLAYCGFSHHFVRAREGWLFVPRVELSLQDTVVDIREWSLDDWRKHPQLSRDMLRAGHRQQMISAAQQSLLDEATRRLGLSPRNSNDQRTQ